MPKMSLEYMKHIISQNANAQFNTDADGNRVQHKNALHWQTECGRSGEGVFGFCNGTFFNSVENLM